MRITVEVDGYEYEGRWLSKEPHRGLHVRGPLRNRPTSGSYRDGEWTDDSGPQGRLDSPRHKRWWRAAHALADAYNQHLDTYESDLNFTER